jgi:hypothetical protein
MNNNPSGWIWTIICGWVLLPVPITLITHIILRRIAARRPRLEYSISKDPDTGRTRRVWMWDIEERPAAPLKGGEA